MYNLVWDRVLGLNLFPATVARKEMAFYRHIQERGALALDYRRLYTKLDWITWTATTTGSRADFEALVAPVFNFLNTTPHRVPMTGLVLDARSDKDRVSGALGGWLHLPEAALRRLRMEEVGSSAVGWRNRTLHY